MKAIVTVQRIARGIAARNRVAGRRIAVEMLRTACLGVAMEIVEAYIREVSVQAADAASAVTYSDVDVLDVFL